MNWESFWLVIAIVAAGVFTVATMATFFYMVFWALDKICQFLGMPLWFMMLMFAVAIVLLGAGAAGMFLAPIS